VKSAELWRQVGGAGVLAHQRFAAVASLDASGWRVTKGDALFPKETVSATLTPICVLGVTRTSRLRRVSLPGYPRAV